MGTLQVDHAGYPVEDHSLACLSRILPGLLTERRFVDIVLVFADEDMPVRITAETAVSIVIAYDIDVGEDAADLLISEYIMMGGLRFVGIDPAT